MTLDPASSRTGSGGGGDQELAYAEATAPITVSGATAATGQVVASSGAIVYAAARICIECFAPRVEVANSGGAFVLMNLFDDATDLGRLTVVGQAAVSGAVLVRRFLTPTAASHTYKVVAWRAVANGTIHCGPGGVDPEYLPAYIRVTLVDSV